MVDAVLAHAGLDDPVALHIAEGGGKDPVVVEGEVAGLALAGDIHPGPEAHGLTQSIGKGLLTGSGRIPGSTPLGSDRRGVGGSDAQCCSSDQGKEDGWMVIHMEILFILVWFTFF